MEAADTITTQLSINASPAPATALRTAATTGFESPASRLMGAAESGSARFRSRQQVSTVAAGTVRVLCSDRAHAGGREARPLMGWRARPSGREH
ncbi:hypothetical protein GCM10010306_091710 [Streptomyces umbrinus]|nr:hypothetical protein GCM10010306_091710 [Streptomyces umbrinus]